MADLGEQLQELKELRLRGSLSEKQFEALKAQLLRGAPKDALPPGRELQIELAALDAHWDAEREQFKVARNGYGWHFSLWHIPEKDEATKVRKWSLVMGSVWMVFSTVIAVETTRQGADPAIWMGPTFGVLIIISGLFQSSEIRQKADAYERAEAKYYDERARIEAKLRALS